MDSNFQHKNIKKFSGYQKRLNNRKEIIKAFKAKLDERRSVPEKIADFITNKFGSMPFLVANLCWFFGWVAINLGLLPNVKPFDPFPFGLLTMVVSLEAIILSIFVLISQNRASKIDDLREEISLHINVISEEEITKMMELQIMLLKKHGIDVSDDQELKEMLEPEDTEKIEKTFENQLS